MAPRHRQQHNMAVIIKITQTPDTDQKAMEMGVFGSHQYCVETWKRKMKKEKRKKKNEKRLKRLLDNVFV